MFRDLTEGSDPGADGHPEGVAAGDAPPPSAMSEALNGLGELDLAIDGHLDWLRQVCRALLRGEPYDPAELAEDADRHCTFGRWQQGCAHGLLQGHALFAELGSLHHRLHTGARGLLSAQGAGVALDPGALAGFLDLVVAFNRVARRLHSEVITDLALRDPLTGVLNRHSMRQHLEAEWARFERLGQPCALAIVDLDHFKKVNDQYGHAVGDAVLRLLAETLGRQLRRYDRLFRMGGEEFLVCLPGVSAAALPIALERLRQSAEELGLPGVALRVTVSIGAARFAPGSGVEASLRRADQALYKAKREGRNRVRLSLG